MMLDYKILLDNVNSMIELLEYNSARCEETAKLNEQHIKSLKRCAEMYKSKLKEV